MVANVAIRSFSAPWNAFSLLRILGGCSPGAIRNRSGVAGSSIAAAVPGLDSGTACRRSSGRVLLCRADQ